jgi:hypothetical protein
MSQATEYLLRWRGRQLGPWSLEEINRRLDAHELGLGHEIQCHGQWMSLEDFFTAVNSTPAASSTALRDQPQRESDGSGQMRPPLPGAGGPALAHPHSAGDSSQSECARPRAQPPPSRSAVLMPDSSANSEAVSSNQFAAVPAAGRPPYRLVYALLAILFGFVGAHNYYARHWLTGLLQLLLSIATYLLGFGIIVPWLWAIVEAVLVRRDGNGREMV